MKTTHDLGGELLALPNLPLEVAGWAPRAGESIAAVLSPDATAILLRSPDYLRASPRLCIVKGCENRSDAGIFVGSVCQPCHTSLTTGVIGHTRSFLGKLAPIEPAEPDTRTLPSHRCQVCGAFWRLWLRRDTLAEDDSWSLCSRACGKCCDNSYMGEQIVPLTLEDMRNYIFDPKS